MLNKLALAVLATSTAALLTTAGDSVKPAGAIPGKGAPAAEITCGDPEVVEVDNVDSLHANIGRNNVDIVMAPGRYVLSACPVGVDEWSSAACGQIEQGQCSVLRSSLRLAAGAHRVPFGPNPEVSHCDAIPAETWVDGAVIDCSALPPSAQEFSCVVAGRQSTISSLTVCNGTPPVPLGPGQLGTHRNGIAVVAGKEALITQVRVVNARRGVLLSSESDQLSRAVVRESLVEGTELAGVAFATRTPDDALTPRRSNRAWVEGHLESTRITGAGLHPILVEYGLGGQDNQTFATLVDNVVDAPSLFSVSIVAAGGGAPGSTSGNAADVSVRGGWLGGNTGLQVLSGPPTGAGNAARVDVDHVTFGNNLTAVNLQLLGAGTSVDLFFDHNHYEGSSPGRFSATLSANSRLRVHGSAHRLETRNHNFDFTNILGYLTDPGVGLRRLRAQLSPSK